MEFDTFLTQVGDFGRYQKKHYIMLALVIGWSAFTNMDFVFTTAISTHWCRIPDILENFTIPEQKEIAIPRLENGKYSTCTIYNLSEWNSFNLSNFSNNASDINHCDDWEYDNSILGKTIVSQWNLVCGEEMIGSSAFAAFSVGGLLGSIIGGTLCDRFGRRRNLLIFHTLNCITGMLCAFSPVSYVYLVACCLRGFFNSGAYGAAFTLIMEIVGAEWRDMVLSVINWWWVAGYLLTGLVAFLVRDWAKLDLLLHGSGLILVVLYAWQTPESPRWLLQQNRVKEAKKILKKMAATNGVKWNKEMENIHVDNEEDSKVTLKKLLQSKTMVMITLICCCMWFTCSLIFYGISLNTTNLVGDPYLNFMISGLVEVPAYGLQWLMLPRLGKRWSVFSTFLLSGLALIATILVPDEHAMVTTALAMVGKLAITIAYGSVFIYTPEMYPTLYRSTGFGISGMASGIGSIAAPYMALLGNVTTPDTPLVIFGVCATVAALSALLLPETNKMILPETLEDVNRFHDNMLLFTCCNKKPRTHAYLSSDIKKNNDMAQQIVLSQEYKTITEQTNL